MPSVAKPEKLPTDFSPLGIVLAMEIQRSLVMVGIAVVTYMMFLAWQEDYGKPAPVADAAVQERTVDDGIPQAVPGSEAVPAIQEAPMPDAEVVAQSQPEPEQRRDITVETDVFRLSIDRQGGDISRVALIQYPDSVETPDQPFVLMQEDQVRTYIAQTGLVGPNGTDSPEGRPLWLADQSHYTLSDDATELNVDLVHRQDGNVEIIKRFTFVRGSYLVRMSHIIRNNSNDTWKGALYGQLRRDASDDPSKATAGFAPMPTYLGGAYWSEETPFTKIDFGDMRDEPIKLTQEGGWIAFLQHYFVAAWIPDASLKHQYTTHYLKSSDEYLLRFLSPTATVAPGEEQVLYTELYAGPKDQDVMESISPGLNMTVDYGWLWFIAQPIFAVLIFLQSGYISIFGNQFDIGAGVGNWGVAIILLTLIIKSLFFKLSAASYRSMAKMRKVAPEMQRIKEQHKNDRQKQSAEMMKLYQKEKINPLGGCLPILVQMPVFISLYYVLLESVELRQAEFFGWIVDLSVMDPYFVLPLLMGASMFFQMRLNPTPADPMQAQVMKWMPIIFTVFFLWFPAGLVLYWLTNNLLGIAQQWFITRSIEQD